MPTETHKKNLSYAIRLAVIYGIIWFIDMLDASLLNVALPTISQFFSINPTNAEWALISFLLFMTIGIIVSQPLGNRLGKTKVFLLAQWLYILSSIGCGISGRFSELVFFRGVQGFSGGLGIPLGMSLLMTYMPQNKWAKTSSLMNVFTLLAPALGPILAGYILFFLNWQWLFFIKIPLSLACVLLSHIWLKKIPAQKETGFNWLGLIYASLSLSFLLIFLSEVGKPLFSTKILIAFLVGALFFSYLFYKEQKRTRHPLVPFKIFKSPLFSWGNVIQSAANIIFLGSAFLIALYLQQGLGFNTRKTGWLMASITLGMASAMPLTGKYYNRVGPLPFIIPGLLLMAAAMFSFPFFSPQTPLWVISLVIFFEGAGSAALMTTNFVSIFSEVPQTLKSSGATLYSIFKQLSASFGIALSTLMLTLQLGVDQSMKVTSTLPKSDFYSSFILLGCIPLLALLFTLKIDNQRALRGVKKSDHLENEFEKGAE